MTADAYAGKLLMAFMAAGVLAVVVSWLLAWRYRRALQCLMQAPLAARAELAMVAAPAPEPVLAAGLATRQRRAEVVLVARLAVLSLLISLSLAGTDWWLSDYSVSPTPRRVLLTTLVHAWPLVPALGLLWRWPRWQVVLAIVLWWAATTAVVMLNSNEQQSLLTVAAWLAGDAMLPLAWLMLICMGQATRALAPWLILPLFLLCLSSVVAQDFEALLVNRHWSVIAPVVHVLGVTASYGLFLLLPWGLLAWPMVALVRAIARAYERQQISDLTALFTVLWTVCVGYATLLQISSSTLWHGLWTLLPLLWLPLFMPLTRHWVPQPAGGRAPVLLVLRVFQRDAQVQSLFDQVVERWRLAGPAVLIAGTDLVDRTLDVGDLFAFLSGRLPQRFIQQAADVAPRLAEFHWQADPDGRWRVNECYCHDHAWREALAALVEHSDRVLMDLRGFQPRNEGCRHELRALAGGRRTHRVVVLTDAHTDLACAQAEAASAPVQRFHWLNTTGMGTSALRQQVLAALLAD